jgi:hypothetical protein
MSRTKIYLPHFYILIAFSSFDKLGRLKYILLSIVSSYLESMQFKLIYSNIKIEF